MCSAITALSRSIMLSKRPHCLRAAGGSLLLCLSLFSPASAQEYPFDWGPREGGRHGRHPYEIGPPIIYLPPPGRFHTPERSPYDFTVRSAGRLQVEVHPPDATVFVDGERVERDEEHAFDLGLLTGKHTMQVARAGYRTRTLRVRIEPAQVTTVSVRLKRQREREP